AVDFKRIENALEVCKKHLDATKTWNTEVEVYLASYVLVIACAEFEQRFEAIVNARCARHPDPALISFMAKATDKLIRSPNVKEMSGFFDKFGGTHKDDFKTH